MKHLYIDSRLRHIAVATTPKAPRQWLFSQGRPWLLLTPKRLARLAAMLGLADRRVDSLVRRIRRECPNPSLFCVPLGLPADPPNLPDQWPLAICPECDGVHVPHPLDAEKPCAECRQAARKREEALPSPGMRLDRERDASVRQWLRENDPSAFDNGVLSPNWRINRTRRLQRDWDDAVNRILLGRTYRRVAREIECSVGLLHRKVKEKMTWECN